MIEYVHRFQLCSYIKKYKLLSSGENALIIASRTNPEVVKYILQSQYCSKDLIHEQSIFNDNILLSACFSGFFKEILEHVINSGYCSEELFLQSTSQNYNILMVVCRLCSASTKCILESNYCTTELFKQRNKNGYDIFYLAKQDNPDIVQYLDIYYNKCKQYSNVKKNEYCYKDKNV